VNHQAQVHSFEPTAEVAEIFKTNIKLNGFSNIEVNEVGIGSHSGSAILRECTGADGLNEGMNYLAHDEVIVQPSDRAVPVVTIEEYCERKMIGSIDIMKIDIEGGEYDALLGARKLLESQAIGCIFIELVEWAAERGGHSVAQIKQLLHETGYQLYQLHSGKLIALQEVEKLNANMAIACSPTFNFSE
jgi:FkbM family methyltransferase